MTDKYSDLPDIDYSSRDVFETSDVESDPDDAPLENDANPDIDSSKADTKAARSRFSHEVISGEVEFLGDIQYCRLRGYNVSRVDETRDEKLARIRRELEELSGTEPENVSEQSGIDELLTVLESIQKNEAPQGYYEKRIDDVLKTEIELSTSTNNPSKETKQSSGVPDVLLLESRINALETVLGADNISQLSAAPKSIQNQINDLTRKINIVYNPEFEINKINQQIRELNREAEKLATNRKLALIASSGGQQVASISSTSAEVKVSKLYDKLPEFEAVNATVPSIINRLKSLHKIHADLGRTIDTVGGIDNTIEALKKDMETWSQSLQKVNQDLDKQNELFESNKAGVEKRIEEMTRVIEEKGKWTELLKKRGSRGSEKG